MSCRKCARLSVIVLWAHRPTLGTDALISRILENDINLLPVH